MFDKIEDKYTIDEEKNIPQIVYGIPDDLRKIFDEKAKSNKCDCVFEAFEGGFFGPSYYYYINKCDGRYLFRFGFSKDGKVISNSDDNDDLEKIEHNKEFYDEFIEKIAGFVKNWDEHYANNEIMDGTQWDLKMKSCNKKFDGSNEFPSNYEEYKNYLNKVFDVDFLINSVKYNIEPSMNMPREVYGIPDTKIFYMDDESELNGDNYLHGYEESKELIRVELDNGKNDYVMMITYYSDFDRCDLMFSDRNNLGDKTFFDITTSIPKNYYSSFIKKFDAIVENWELNYSGDSQVKWSINIKNGGEKWIIGKGGFPSNWNDLIELVAEYEILFKQKKAIDCKKNEEKGIEPENELVDKYLKEIEDDVDEEMVKRGLLSIVDGKKIPVFGSNHTRLAIEKKYLKERYDIDWQTSDDQ